MESEIDNQEVAIPGTGLVIMYGSTEIGRVPGPDMPGGDPCGGRETGDCEIGGCDTCPPVQGPAPVPAPVIVKECMGEITHDDLKFMVDILLTIGIEGRFHLRPGTIELKMVSTANVSMISFELNRDHSQGILNSVNNRDIGVDIALLKKILPGKKKEMISLWVDDKTLYLEGETESTSLKLLDINTIRKDPNPPVIDLKGPVGIDPGTFYKYLKNVKAVTDKVLLEIKPGEVVVSGEGDTSRFKGSMVYDQVQGSFNEKALFSLDYLYDMARVLKGLDILQVSFKTDYPLKIEGRIFNGAGKITYLLAPRVESA